MLGISTASIVALLIIDVTSSTVKTALMLFGIVGALTGLVGIYSFLIFIVALMRGKKWWR
ncbi:hypothetical protein CO724_02875 [Ectopseudomonas mendocina]|jgi:hypothetical protein|nr:hypothetical protein CO724_02875 [Pseudomonas mendocina]